MLNLFTESMETEERKCEYCGKPIEGRRNKIYCDSTCRSKATMKRMGAEIIKSEAGLSALPTPTDAASSFIIKQLERDRDKLDAAYEKELAINKELRDKLSKVEKDFSDYKNNQRIKAIEEAKPQGLNGFLDSQAGNKLLAICAPYIQNMVENATQPKTLTGTPANSPIAALAAWFEKLPLDVKQSVWKMLQAMTMMPHEKLGPYCMEIAKVIIAEYPHANPQPKEANG